MLNIPDNSTHRVYDTYTTWLWPKKNKTNNQELVK